MSALSARLDRIPYFRFHRRLLLMGGLGLMFDAMDVAIIAFVLPVIKSQWALSTHQVGLLAAAAAMGGFIGAGAAGVLGDLFGRRTVMMFALAIYAIASLASAFSASWTEFLVWRVIAGVGVYGESAIIAPFLAEFAGPTFRGKYVGTLTGFFGFGFVAAALLGYLLIPSSPDSWRYALVISALPIVMLLWWRRSLPESPRWLETRGRVCEAESVIASIEAEYERSHGACLPPAMPVAYEQRLSRSESVASSMHALLRSPLLRLACMGLIVWFAMGFSYYAFFTWIPSLLVARGHQVTTSYLYSLAIYLAQIPGYFSAAMLNDVIGRQAVITSYMLLAGLAALWLAFSDAALTQLAAGICLSFFMNGTYAGLYAYTPELFPTSVRATAQGITSSASRIGAVLSPILVGNLFPGYGFGGVFGMTCTVLVTGACAVALLGVSTKNRALEQIR